MVKCSEKLKKFLEEVSFYKKEVLFIFRNQTLTTTGVDNDNMRISLVGLQSLKKSIDKKNIFGNADHYFSGSPKSKIGNVRIEKIDDLYHLKADTHILDKKTLDRFRNGELKGISITFTQK